MEIPRGENGKQNTASNPSPKVESPHTALTHIDPKTGLAVTKEEYTEIMRQLREEQQ